MPAATLILLNPDGHGGAVGGAWRRGQKRILEALAPTQVELVGSSQEARQAVLEGARQGYGKLIAAGGAETGHGLVSGLMALDEGRRKRLKMGFLSLHRPTAWALSTGFPTSLNRQLEVLRAGHSLPHDVGRVVCQDSLGQPVEGWFFHGAALGLLGPLRQVAKDWRAPLANGLRMALTLRKALNGADSQLRITAGGAAVLEGPVLVALVMVGSHYPLLGAVVEQTSQREGLLSLLGVAGEEKWALVKQLSGLVSHTKMGRELLTLERAPDFSAQPLAGQVGVEVDGQELGQLPASFSVVPLAVNVIVDTVAKPSQQKAFNLLGELAGSELAQTGALAHRGNWARRNSGRES